VQTWFKADEVGTYAVLHDLLRHQLPGHADHRPGGHRLIPAYIEQLQKDLTAARGIIADAQKGAAGATRSRRRRSP
jgi:hypothetical protein